MNFRWRLLIILLAILASSQSVAGMRCDNKLVSEGDSFATVLAVCGEADATMSLPDKIIYQEVRQLGQSMAIAEVTRVDLWVYRFGPNHFTRNLYFENGILVKIELGEHGS